MAAVATSSHASLSAEESVFLGQAAGSAARVSIAVPRHEAEHRVEPLLIALP